MGFASYDGRAPGALLPGDVSDEQAEAAAPPADDREESPMDVARSPLDRAHDDDTLSERDRRILEFERQWWKYAGAKEQAIRDLFDMSATRYYQILNALLDQPAALAFDPMLIKRLRRMRAARQRARSARRLGIEL
ncbi:MAG: DUF3263 domain-containing protein [Candidatus Nanopelagicales bacterium]